MVMRVFHEPSGPRIERCKYLVVGAFQFRHFSEFGRRFRTGDGTFRLPGQNIFRGIGRALVLPDVAGHAIDQRPDVFWMGGSSVTVLIFFPFL